MLLIEIINCYVSRECLRDVDSYKCWRSRRVWFGVYVHQVERTGPGGRERLPGKLHGYGVMVLQQRKPNYRVRHWQLAQRLGRPPVPRAALLVHPRRFGDLRGTKERLQEPGGLQLQPTKCLETLHFLGTPFSPAHRASDDSSSVFYDSRKTLLQSG